MKTLIISVNSKYIHSALSVWYLKANCSEDCSVMEFSINEPVGSVYCKILAEKPDTVAFSCYIWNIEYVLKLSELLKKARPECRILLGGPEVSYTSEEILTDNPFIDCIMLGEGEDIFSEVIKGSTTVSGIAYRENDTITINGSYHTVKNLDSIKSPYTDEMLAAAEGKIIYYESSRGCPFSCSYCLSSTFDGVRYFSMPRVLSELSALCRRGIKQIKFVDRTFNCNKKRFTDIITFILNDTSKTTFHFEIAAELLDEDEICLLAKLPPGKVQLEIGVQSVNPHALEAVRRKTDTDKVLKTVSKLLEPQNIHIHLDLIAGLPHEDFASFCNSFNKVCSVRPHQLQLGFLKLLKGAEIRAEQNEHGFRFASFPPYEIISNKYISAQELLELKRVEDVLDRYYNSGRFSDTLNTLAKNNPFEFYRELADYASFDSPPSSEVLFDTLHSFIEEKHSDPSLSDMLKLDYLTSSKFGRLPRKAECKYPDGFKEKCFEYLKSVCPDIPARDKYKTVRFEYLEHSGRTIMLDYQDFNPVTGRYSYEITDI